ncbi:hypothetical protein P3339_06955 [Microbulbifer sp. MLAF003]|uniref:hypothetical protein n=1 Tax=unclassified Microbulbifer TaxID=2619833 RepID=UPI0024AD21AE|nr:hypothetical protein [Microbulbifer sp. MLAF003]WHI52499.1 hypothetical protein P3339_06955 [Microbulbifer sp. MLAF003]
MDQAIPFKEFWAWLAEHPNCILRAGSTDSVVYDDDDYYWRFAEEDARTLLVQVIRGKRPVAEFFIEPAHVSTVRVNPGERGEFNFDLVTEFQGQMQVIFYFVLSHGFDEEVSPVEESSHTSGNLH